MYEGLNYTKSVQKQKLPEHYTGSTESSRGCCDVHIAVSVFRNDGKPSGNQYIESDG